MVAGEADGAADQEMIEVDLDFIQVHEVACCAVLQVLCAVHAVLSCCLFD